MPSALSSNLCGRPTLPPLCLHIYTYQAILSVLALITVLYHQSHMRVYAMVSNGGWLNIQSPRRVYLSEALARQGDSVASDRQTRVSKRFPWRPSYAPSMLIQEHLLPLRRLLLSISSPHPPADPRPLSLLNPSSAQPSIRSLPSRI